MEPRPKSYPFHHSEPTGLISAKGKIVFELGEHGVFKVSRTEFPDDDLDSRSETSSMEANATTVPDINSIEIDEVDWAFTTTLNQRPPMEPFRPLEKSQLIGGVGEWTEGLGWPLMVPWRLAAVSLDDLELATQDLGPVHADHVRKADFTKPHTSFHSSQWNPRLVSRSIAESAESVPGLTEDSSRDSDSIAMSEHLLNQEELLSQQQWLFPAKYEAEAPISPQLGSVGAGFMTDFDQFTGTIESSFEIDDRAIIYDRPPLRETSNPVESSIVVDFEAFANDSTISDSDSTDSESIWMSDYSEGIPMLEDGHPFLLIKSTVVREGLLAFQNSQQRPQAGSSSAAAGRISTSTGRGKSSSSTRTKRNNRRESSEDAGGSGDDQDAPEKRRRTSKKASGHHVSFACPFCKKDPLKYRSCYAYVLSRIRDVKQHLSRYHQLPIYCPRCMCTFEAEDERDGHVRASSCLIQDTISYEGVTRAQKVQLTQRVSSKMPLEDQWFSIFDILFPGHTPRPRSAYINVELTVELESFQDFMYAEGPTIILTAIRSRGIHVATIANEERDLSALLQSAIEEGLQTIAQRWSANSVPDPSTSHVAATDGSSSSHASNAVEGSEPSRSSSDTLFEILHEGYTAVEQDHQGNNRDQQQDGNGLMPATELLEATSPRQEDMVVDTPRFGDAGQLNFLPSETLTADQGYLEPTFDTDMDNENDIWKRINHGDFFDANVYGNNEDTAQLPEDSQGYQPQFHEGQDM